MEPVTSCKQLPICCETCAHRLLYDDGTEDCANWPCSEYEKWEPDGRDNFCGIDFPCVSGVIELWGHINCADCPRFENICEK